MKLHLVLRSFQTYLEHGINHITTRTHPFYCERYIRTFKKLLYMRLDDIKKHWTGLMDNLYNVYNNKMIHSTTHFTPQDALDPSNWVNVKLKLKSIDNTLENIQQSKLEIKENKSVWLPGIEVVQDIQEKFNQQFYKVSNFPK